MCSVVQLYTTVATQTIHRQYTLYSGWCISSGGSSGECESLRTKGARWTPSCVRIAGHQLLSLRLSFHTRAAHHRHDCHRRDVEDDHHHDQLGG